MEGFWGVLKRRLKTTGGIRRERLHLYVAEEVWRYNQRKLTEEQQIERLLTLLGEKFVDKFGLYPFNSRFVLGGGILWIEAYRGALLDV